MSVYLVSAIAQRHDVIRQTAFTVDAASDPEAEGLGLATIRGQASPKEGWINHSAMVKEIYKEQLLELAERARSR